jgi:hypothetical protein
VVPAGLAGKLALSIRLFFGHLPIFAALTLTFWAPLNYFVEQAAAQNPNPDNPFFAYRLNSLAEGIFGPIPAAAIVTVLAGRMTGRRVTYLAALRAGFHHWGRLLWARFTTGVLIGLGTLALIVPGVMLAVRYSLVDPIVVLEGAGASDSRERSSALTRGRRWSIFLGGVAILGSILVLSFIPGMAQEVLEIPDSLALVVALDCFFDLVSVLLTCFVFVFYWETRQGAGPAKPAEPSDLSVRTRFEPLG